MTLAEMLDARKKELIAIGRWRERKRLRWQIGWTDTGECRKCGRPSEIRIKTGEPYRYCARCQAEILRARLFGKKSVDLPANG